MNRKTAEELTDNHLFSPLAYKLMAALRHTLSRFNSTLDEIDLPAPDSDLEELMEYTCFRHLRDAYQQGQAEVIGRIRQKAVMWRDRAAREHDLNWGESWEARAKSCDLMADELESADLTPVLREREEGNE